MDRSRTKKQLLSDDSNDDYVPGTLAERIALVWPLTKEVASLSVYDVEQRLRGIVPALSDRSAEPMTIPSDLRSRP
jgi:hypothetical protein